MVNFDRLIYIYCLLQDVCEEFWLSLNGSIFSFLDSYLDGFDSEEFFGAMFEILGIDIDLSNVTLFEFLFGSLLIFILGYNLVKWIVSIVPG